jgi:hypothetical protein
LSRSSKKKFQLKESVGACCPFAGVKGAEEERINKTFVENIYFFDLADWKELK